MQQHRRRRALGNILIVLGILILLGVAGAWGWEQWQAKQLRDQLQAEPVAAAASLPVPPTVSPVTQAPPTIAPASATPAPVATGVPPTATVAQAPTATSTPTPLPGTAPVRLQIPDLKLDVPVVDMAWTVVSTADGPSTDWQIPENAAGRAVDSALLGQPDNLGLSGHNNIYGQVFRPISLSWPDKDFERVDAYTDRAHILDGRQIRLLGADGRQFDYVITAFYRLKDSGVPQEQRVANARYMAPTGRAQLTLITCWPPWSNTHRLVVLADPAG